MQFDAIVHAPTLRVGARLNIAAADQMDNGSPPRLADGAVVRLRFGVCCPGQARGTIRDYRSEAPERATLSIDALSWTIGRGEGGVTEAGLLSETWFVIAAAEAP